jgi:hypothetical protein
MVGFSIAVWFLVLVFRQTAGKRLSSQLPTGPMPIALSSGSSSESDIESSRFLKGTIDVKI